MEIIEEQYQVRYDAEKALVSCDGVFRPYGPGVGYRPILDLLLAAADSRPPVLTLDLRQARFMNSEGINTLFKLLIRVRKHGESDVRVRANLAYPWQSKSLKNLTRILPSLELEFT